MEFQYFGANCLRITTKHANIIIDDNLADFGLKSPAKTNDIMLFTGAHSTPEIDAKIIIDQPGEYEVSGISIVGLPARAHLDEEGITTSTIYKIVTEDIRVLVTGHIYPDLSDRQLEIIGIIDIMIVPVGGNGYTLDSIGALKVIKKVEPKLIIPVHYADKNISYSVPQQDLTTVMHDIGIEAKENVTKLKVRANDLQEGTQLVILERQ